MRPSIIFFDEIDGLAPVRSSKQDQTHSSIVSTLLTLMERRDCACQIKRHVRTFDIFWITDSNARKEIFQIDTRDWTPKPLDAFLEELAKKCVGYCGAGIKSLCAEAALCALRRCYPQIYKKRPTARQVKSYFKKLCD
ncbi:hypothetical protein AV530_010258 [Patagioenas fasciata monilis]|uniref:ATPase AAA-type core domain-containing protein n=1 Tax=Patagioenas fasciata monilis TaxID=372326 RepID=A0A1V4JCM5_PATFA|nr:hypothetical protein AV530_010258 [Patagioenas fasciata monilis]